MGVSRYELEVSSDIHRQAKLENECTTAQLTYSILTQSRTQTQGRAVLTVGWALLCKLIIKTVLLTGMPTDQPDR